MPAFGLAAGSRVRGTRIQRSFEKEGERLMREGRNDAERMKALRDLVESADTDVLDVIRERPEEALKFYDQFFMGLSDTQVSGMIRDLVKKSDPQLRDPHKVAEFTAPYLQEQLERPGGRQWVTEALRDTPTEVLDVVEAEIRGGLPYAKVRMHSLRDLVQETMKSREAEALELHLREGVSQEDAAQRVERGVLERAEARLKDPYESPLRQPDVERVVSEGEAAGGRLVNITEEGVQQLGFKARRHALNSVNKRLGKEY